MRELTEQEIDQVAGAFGIGGAAAGAIVAIATGLHAGDNASQIFVSATLGALSGAVGGGAAVMWASSRAAGATAFALSVGLGIGGSLAPGSPSLRTHTHPSGGSEDS